jgi:hypothetical protein
MTNSIIEKRLTRNLRYKLTYIKIFETYMELDPGPAVVELLRALIQAQQAAIAPLSSYLRQLDVSTQDLELDSKLLGHASGRDNIKTRLRFIYEGLTRAVSWYKMQLVDRQMTADPDLRQLLFELGEIDAAQLWRTEATMAMIGIPLKAKEKDWRDQPRQQPDALEGWRPRLVEDVGRPAWSSDRPPRYSGGSSSRRREW